MAQTRREFIRNTAVLAAWGAVVDWASASSTSDRLGEVLPTRKLTREGEKVTALSLGGYHLGSTENPRQAQQMIERSLELGIRFFDNARKYHDGRSEDYMGRFLTPKYREHIFLMSKAPDPQGAGVRRQLEESLAALKTDYLDLWQIHALQTPKDVDQRIKNGVVDAFLEAKEKGKVRYIGFTGHQNPTTHLHFLDFLEQRGLQFDVCQMPLNVCDPSFESFETHVLPVLLRKNYGVIAMKTMAGGSLMGERIDTTPREIRTQDIPDVVSKTDLTLANLHQYVYSLPVSSLCTGCREVREIEENVAVLRNLKDLSAADKDRLVAIAKPYAGLTVENYKRVL
jgi:aryl-alcohol dehydrogenase-like predicted oxidoreductase